MPDTIEAAPQPVATPIGGEKKEGSANLSGQQLAQHFFKREIAQQEAAKKPEAETPAAEPEPIATGEAQAKPAETPVETKAVTSAEEKPEADEVLSPETNSLDPKLQDKINRRIGKEVAKRKELERQLQEIKDKLVLTPAAEVKPEKTEIAPLPQGVPALSNIESMQGLAALQQQAKTAIRWGEEQLDREDFDANPPVNEAGQPFQRAQIKAAMRNARMVLEDQIPQRAQFLAQRQQIEKMAGETFPYLRDKSSVEYQHAQQILRENTWLGTRPERDWLLGVHIEGLKAIEAKAAAAKKTAATKPAAAKPKTGNSQTEVSADSTSTRIPVTTQTRQQLQAASDKLKAKGSVSGKEYAQHLALQSQLRNSR